MLQRDAHVQLISGAVAPLANVENDRHRLLILPEILQRHASVHHGDVNPHPLAEGGESGLGLLAIRCRLLVTPEIAQRNASICLRQIHRVTSRLSHLHDGSAYYQSLPQLLALNERYLSGISSPYHLALLDDDHVIADLNYFGHVMCDVQERNIGSLLRRLYFHEQARSGLRGNRRERLVKQGDRRVTRQGARQSDSLALAPRHF